MVYESDFYTTRRSRPTVSTYSVTSPITRILPSISRVHTYTTSYPIFSSYSTFPTVYHRSIPYIAHKRLVTATRITTTPSRVMSSEVRVITSPVRTVHTYTSSYPVYSSYSTFPTVYHRSIPYAAHKRLVTATRITTTPSRVIRSPVRVITSPVRTVNIRVRPSVINRAYDRIEHKMRTNPHYYATESYLNSDSVRAFDDETKDIRTSTNALLHKVHERVDRARSVSPIYYSSRYEDRYGPDSYISTILGPIKGDSYESPRRFKGKSHLASFRIVGDTAYAKRRPTTMYDDDKVRNDVNLLSYYLKNRRAASSPKQSKVILASAKLDPNRPSRKFAQAKESEDPNLEMKAKQASRFDRFNTQSDDIDLEKKKAQRLEAARLMEERAIEEEKARIAEEAKRDEEARQAELERQEQLAAQAAAERQAELERKAEEERIAEEERLAEEARIAEEERLLEEERLAEEARIAEEERLIEEARLAEAERIAEEERRVAEEARLAAEAEEARKAEEARLAEEQRLREEELIRLAELERIAEEEKEGELARQAAELAEIARQQEAEAQREAEELEMATSPPPPTSTDDIESESAVEPEPIDESEPADDLAAETNYDDDIAEPIVEEED